MYRILLYFLILLFPLSLSAADVTGLSASDAVWPGVVKLSWKKTTIKCPMGTGCGYALYRDNDLIWSSPVDVNDEGFHPVVQYVDTLSNTDEHQYAIRMFYDEISGPAIGHAFIGELSWPVVGRAASQHVEPVGLQASRGTHIGKVILEWTATKTAKKYKIYRSGEFYGYSLTNSYEDIRVDQGLEYRYEAEAFDEHGKQVGERTGVVVGFVGQVLPAPENINASDGLFENAVNITWSAITGADKYLVYRDERHIATVLDNAFRDTASVPGVISRYQVAGMNAAGVHALSDPEAGYSILEPSSRVDATKGDFTEGVKIEWLPVENASSYGVYRDNEIVGTVGSDITEFVDHGLTDTLTHYYGIVANAGSVEGTMSQLVGGYKNVAPSLLEGNYSISHDMPPFGYRPKVVDANTNDRHVYEIVTVPQHGNVLVKDNICFYTAEPGFLGQDSYEVKATDKAGEEVIGIVYVTVTKLGYVDLVLSGQLKITEDVVSDPFTPEIKGIGVGVQDSFLFDVISKPQLGTVEIQSNAIVYLPNINVSGSEKLLVSATDKDGYSVTGVIEVSIMPVNDIPVSLEGSFKVYPDRPSEPFSPVVIDPDLPADKHVFTIVEWPEHGILKVNRNNELVYEPEEDYKGEVTATVRATDIESLYVDGVITITVLNKNAPPSALYSEITTEEDTPSKPTSVTVDDEDTDDVHRLLIVSQPTHGQVVLSNNLLVYTPDDDYYGNDTFMVRALDPANAYVDGHVSVTVTPVDDPPIALPGLTEVLEGTQAEPYSPPVEDPDGRGAFQLSLFGPASQGRAEIINNQIVYHAPADYVGADSFMYQATDETGLTDTALIKVNVQPRLRADLSIRNEAGKAPFSAHVVAEYNNPDPLSVLGTITWYLKSGGGDWRQVEGNPFFVDLKLDKGTYFVKAELTDTRVGETHETNTLSLSAFSDIDIDVKGNRYSWPGTAMELQASLVVEGKVVKPADVEIEWLLSSGSVQHGEQLTLNRYQVGDEKVTIRARPKSGHYDWEQRDMVVKFDKPVAMSPRIIVDDDLQYGQEHAVQALLLPSVDPRKLPEKIRKNTRGEWTLPDGKRIEGNKVLYVPTDDDAKKGYVDFKYRTWVKGYETQGTVKEVSLRRAVNSYEWPKFHLSLRYKANEVPALVDVYVKHDAMGALTREVLRKEAKYEFYLPVSRQVRLKRRGRDFIQSEFLTPGIYPVRVRVTDLRGHESRLEHNIVVRAPRPLRVRFKKYYSNRHMREPLTAYIQPVIEGMHALDSVERYRYLVDGKPIKINKYRLSQQFGRGKHSVRFEVLTKAGKRAAYQDNFEVKRNAKPVCKLGSKERPDQKKGYVYPICDDSDGFMRKYEWNVNGESYGKRANIQYTYDRPVVLNVSMTATDDGGAKTTVTDSFSFGNGH